MGWFDIKKDKDISADEKKAAQERMRERQKKSGSSTYGINTGHEKKRSSIFDEFRDTPKK